jgi:hypothetical protein
MEANKAGAGIVKVLIPESTKKIIGNSSEDIIFGAATKSGGFSQAALAEFQESSNWSDAIMLSGELGNNSDTTILFEKFLEKLDSALIISGDAFDFSKIYFDKLLKSHNVIFILDLPKLQKLAVQAGLTKPVISSISLINLIEVLHELTDKNKASIVMEYNEFLVVASQGYVSTTPITNRDKLQIKMVAHASVWFMQNQNKIFEALSCSTITCQT